MKTRSRPVPRAKRAGRSPADIRAALAIRDADIDVLGLVERIAENHAARRKLPALPPLAGGAALFEERALLKNAVHALYRRMLTFGIVATHQKGWWGRVDLFFKRLLRRLVQRHLHQQQLVHEELLKTLEAFIHYLDHQDRLLRQALESGRR